MMNVDIAFGVITNYIDNPSPYLKFLENASKHNYKPPKLIIAYSHGFNNKIVERLKQITELYLIKIPADQKLQKELKKIGLSNEAIKTFLFCEKFSKYGLIPYGKRRNIVLIKAALLAEKLDYLFFIDTDVKPYILLNNKGKFAEVNYIKRHLQHLKKKNVVISSSDYSGYYIIPPIKFSGLKDLLIGLQKQEAYEIFNNNPSGLITAHKDAKNIQESNKVLGGNHALKLSESKNLSPYFSTTYTFKKQLFLGRGEDTLLGKNISLRGKKIIDIDTRIFHNTFGNFPEKPDIKEKDIQERFYLACMGWLGRNPFLNWYLKEIGEITYQEFKSRKEEQKEKLLIASPKLVNYLHNNSFAHLPDAFDSAYTQLEKMKEEFNRTYKAWEELVKIIK